MPKPPILQKLSHDKMLTKGNFPGFVETWNYTVNRANNLKGDYDVNPKNGCIQVDNSDPEYPVIRFTGTEGTSAQISGYTGTLSTITGVELTLTALSFTMD